MNYWVSWNELREPFWNFEYHGPWWTSGRTGDGKLVFVSAVVADSPAEAIAIIAAAHDPPIDRFALEVRFVIERPFGWEPFGERFPRAEWMRWPWTECRSQVQ